MTIEQIQHTTEFQVFDRKSARIDAKGEHYYEDAPVNNAGWEDLDMTLVDDYVKLIGYGKGAETYIRENGYVVRKEDYRGREYEALTGAAVLLFGKNPQRFFQRAQVRVIRYDGTEAKVGTEKALTGCFARWKRQAAPLRSIVRTSSWSMPPSGSTRMQGQSRQTRRMVN